MSRHPSTVIRGAALAICGLMAAMVSLNVSPLVAQGLTAGDQIAALKDVGIDQRLDAQVPMHLELIDDRGSRVLLGDFLGDRPAILVLAYYECPMLCTQVLNGLLRSVRTLGFTAGEEFDIVTVSIDPGETPELAAEKKKHYVEAYQREAGPRGWHFLTGSESVIEELARSVGFRYRYDEATDLYSHASAIILLTPEGRVSRYMFGVDYAPRDLRLGLVEASANKIGSPIDQVLLFCYRYDPAMGQYTLSIMKVLRLAALLTVVLIAGFMIAMLRRDRKLKNVAAPVKTGFSPVTQRK